MRLATAVSSLVLLFILVVAPGVALADQAQPSPPPLPPQGTAPVELILDASGSMRADDGTGRPKLDAAKEALGRLVEELPADARVGLRLYGHRTPNTDREAGCRDTELIVPIGPLRPETLKSAVEPIQPSGYTPIGASLEAAADDFEGEGPQTIILVSDGIDTCAPPNPCDVARELVARDVRLRVETVGFQVDPTAAEQLRCIAEVTGGSFTPADDADELVRALRSYQPTGKEIEGGKTKEEALELRAGQYLDTIAPFEERWYAVDVAQGQRLRAVGTIVGEEDGPVSVTARFSGAIAADDIIGENTCAQDEVQRVGQEARQVRLDGAVSQEERICAEPGTYLIRLALDDPAEEDSPLVGAELPVELLVSLVGEEVLGEPQPTPTTVARQPPPEDPPQIAGIDSGALLLTGVLTLAVGYLVGMVVARRTGP